MTKKPDCTCFSTHTVGGSCQHDCHEFGAPWLAQQSEQAENDRLRLATLATVAVSEDDRLRLEALSSTRKAITE